MRDELKYTDNTHGTLFKTLVPLGTPNAITAEPNDFTESFLRNEPIITKVQTGSFEGKENKCGTYGNILPCGENGSFNMHSNNFDNLQTVLTFETVPST